MRKRGWGGNLKEEVCQDGQGREQGNNNRKPLRPARNIVERRGRPRTRASAVRQQETVSAQQEAAFKSPSVCVCILTFGTLSTKILILQVRTSL